MTLLFSCGSYPTLSRNELVATDLLVTTGTAGFAWVSMIAGACSHRRTFGILACYCLCCWQAGRVRLPAGVSLALCLGLVKGLDISMLAGCSRITCRCLEPAILRDLFHGR